MNKRHLLIWPHMGLGDFIITHGIVRHLARENDLICLPVKHHNLPSVNFMFRDLPNVCLRGVEDDAEARMFAETVWKGQKLFLGCHGNNFTSHDFDQCFYRQADLSFELRWSNFKVVRDLVSEEKTAKSIWEKMIPDGSNKFVFVHDDPGRGYEITKQYCDDLQIVSPLQRVSPNIFDYLTLIEESIQVHCISSSFALMIDSFPDLFAMKPLFLHHYARKEPLPQFKLNWRILE